MSAIPEFRDISREFVDTSLIGAPIGPIREQPFGRAMILQLTKEIKL